MNAAAVIVRRRDPAVIAGRAHAILDAAARTHAQWPRSGRLAMNEAFLVLHTSLEEYGTAVENGGDTETAAEAAAWAMALLLAAVASFLGTGTADEMARNAAEVAR